MREYNKLTKIIKSLEQKSQRLDTRVSTMEKMLNEEIKLQGEK